MKQSNHSILQLILTIFIRKNNLIKINYRIEVDGRPELIVQGSVDKENWFTYDFKYKPDSLNDKSEWLGPYMPRLDREVQ